MTTYAWDVPGYIQGHRFSDNPRYWNGTKFRDLAGYGHLGNYVELQAGTPIFAAHGANNRTGLRLNNATIFKFHPSIPWEGSMLFVFRPTTPGGLYLIGHMVLLFGNMSSEVSNGRVNLSKQSGDTFTLSAATPATVTQVSLTSYANNTIAIGVFSFNQSDAVAKATKDGVTIVTDSSISGNSMAIGSVSGVPPIEDIGGVSHDYVRLGDLVGDGARVANDVDYLHIFEQHFWKGDVINDNQEKLVDFITSLEEYYGI